MRGQRSVDRAGRPTIVVGAHIFNDSIPARALETRTELRSDLAKHRLDRPHHSGPQFQTTAAAAVVVDLRVLVHAASDPVSDEVPDDVEPVLFGVLLDRGTDVAEVSARAHFFDGQLQTFARRIDQLLRARCDLADRNWDRAVADEAIEDRAEVE